MTDTGRGAWRGGGWEGDNLLACAHPQMREIPLKCSSCGALFPCLPGVSSTATEWRPRHCCERSRAAALFRQSRRSNALLLCIVRGRIKKWGGAHTREPRDVPTLIVRSENVDDDVDVTSTTGASIIRHFAFVKPKREPR